jgi:hypothetical protein
MTPTVRICALAIGIAGMVFVVRRENHGPVLFGEDGKKAAVSAIVSLISLSALTAVLGHGFLLFCAGLVVGFILGSFWGRT